MESKLPKVIYMILKQNSSTNIALFVFSSVCRFGRRFVVLLSLFLLLLFGVGAGFSPNIYVYMVLKFLGGISISGIIANAFVIGRYNVQN